MSHTLVHVIYVPAILFSGTEGKVWTWNCAFIYQSVSVLFRKYKKQKQAKTSKKLATMQEMLELISSLSGVDFLLRFAVVLYPPNPPRSIKWSHRPNHWTGQRFPGVGSSPLVTVEELKKAAIQLKCNSDWWFPQPQVQWIDQNGKVIHRSLSP